MVGQRVDLLAIGVHPDDVELSCSGTILRHQALGYTCSILDLTQGELGTRGNAQLRREEARAAADVLQVKHRYLLDIPDGFFEPEEAHKRQIIQVIRDCRPRVVLANAVDDRHPDHGRAARMVYDSCFLSGLSKIKTNDGLGTTQKAWRPEALYHYTQDKNLKADLVVDITPYIHGKMKSIMAFRSQFYDPQSTEQDSPISGLDFLEFIKARARVYGRQIGVEFGEGYTISRPVGVSDLMHLI